MGALVGGSRDSRLRLTAFATTRVYFSGITTTTIDSELSCETVDGRSRCTTADPGYSWSAEISDVTWGSSEE